MGTQVVSMTNWWSSLIYPEIIYDEAVGLLLDGWHLLLVLHYYSIDIIISYVSKSSKMSAEWNDYVTRELRPQGPQNN